MQLKLSKGMTFYCLKHFTQLLAVACIYLSSITRLSKAGIIVQIGPVLPEISDYALAL